MYPTESMQAYPDMTADTTFNLAMKLSAAGLDYDFIDFRSLRQASFDKSSLHIMNEKYKVMVIAGMKAMHFFFFAKNLGIITGLVALFWQQGELPSASSREGEQDKEVDENSKRDIRFDCDGGSFR